jgi:UDP-N-acetylmuramyl pentapeptide phosphotransferase/UDP-N-acetylglucosamine-1-phosphate transferase
MFYVNFCSIALAVAILGFLPFNMSKSKKIFMGDAGSLFVGFVMANLAMGTSYSSINNFGIFAPLFILAIPIYETILVSVCRIRKGKLPFLGSKDHYALRLEKMGFSRKNSYYNLCCEYIFFYLCLFVYFVNAWLFFNTFCFCKCWYVGLKYYACFCKGRLNERKNNNNRRWDKRFNDCLFF